MTDPDRKHGAAGAANTARIVNIAAAQMEPIARIETRAQAAAGADAAE